MHTPTDNMLAASHVKPKLQLRLEDENCKSDSDETIPSNVSDLGSNLSRNKTPRIQHQDEADAAPDVIVKAADDPVPEETKEANVS